MKKIKIVHILHSVGGVEVSLRQILENIDSVLFENIIIHGNNDESNYFDSKKQNIKEYKTTIYRDISLLKDLNGLIRILRILRKEKPDLIHTHSAKGGILGRIAGKVLQIKVLHTPQAFSYLSTDSKFKRNIYLLIEKIFRNNNTILLASSDSEKERAINEVGYKANKVIVFNNSILPVQDNLSLSINKSWPESYICTVGRPSFQKNIEEMVKVFYEVNTRHKSHLVIMGVGYYSPELESIKQLINELGLNNKITLLEWTNREDVFYIIKNSQFYLSTARYEGLPYSVIEALALSRPCIVSDCDGNKDLIQNNYNGYVIKNNCIPDYVEKIEKFLNNKELLGEFSKKALKSFNQNYNIKNNISILERIYKEYSLKNDIFERKK